MTKKRVIKSTIKTSNEPLSANPEDTKKIEEIKNILKQLPLKEPVEPERLDKWANELYKILFEYDRSVKKHTAKQAYEYLKNLDKLLKKLEDEIKKLPFEIKDLLIDPDYLCMSYLHIFSDTDTISKARYLIERAKTKSSYLQDTENSVLGSTKGERGNKENLLNSYLSERLAFIYYDLTGRKPGREIDGVDYAPKGKYFLFVTAIFRLGKIKASAEDQVRKSSKKFKQTPMELIDKK